MISTTQGVPLGILEQQIWTLTAQEDQEKESADTKKHFEERKQTMAYKSS